MSLETIVNDIPYEYSSQGLITTLFVLQYSLKYSKSDGIICVTLPGFVAMMHESEQRLPDTLVTKLRECGWSKKGINRFEQLLLHQSWSWKTGLRLNPKTGHLSIH